MIIDTHTHVFEKVYDSDFEPMMANLKRDNLESIFVVGYDLESSVRAVQIAKDYNNAYAIVGFHPEHADLLNHETYEKLKQLASNQKVVAIGEIGLDYYYSVEHKVLQQKTFIKQLELAHELKLPVAIHLRDAFNDMISLLTEHKDLLEFGGVMHCFSGNVGTAKTFLDLGFSLAFGGKVTFANAKENVEVAVNTPLDRILLETDCPFLAPVPHRGQRNEPKYCNLVAEKLASIKQISIQELERITLENTHRVFSKIK